MPYSIQITEQDEDQALIEVFNVTGIKNTDTTFFESTLVGVLLVDNEQITNIYQGNGFNLGGKYFTDYDIESVKNKKLHGVCKCFHDDELYSLSVYYDDKPLKIFKPNNHICNACLGVQFKFIYDLGLTVCMNKYDDEPQEIVIERKYIEGGYVDKIKNYELLPTIDYDSSNCPFYLEQITENIDNIES